jgi:hypothetical protein
MIRTNFKGRRGKRERKTSPATNYATINHMHSLKCKFMKIQNYLLANMIITKIKTIVKIKKETLR